MASYLEIKITPKKNVQQQQPKEEPPPLLVLAPFTKPPTVEFSNVRVGTAVAQMVLVRNPSANKLQVEISRMLPEERGVLVRPVQFLLEAGQEKPLEVQWRPQVKGSWRDVMQVKAGRLQLDVVFLFSADAPGKNKKKNTRPLSTQNTNVHVVGKKSNMFITGRDDGASTSSMRSSQQSTLKAVAEKQEMYIAMEHLWEDKENIESSSIPAGSQTFTHAFDSSFRWPDVTASTPVRRETYTLTVEQTPDCFTVRNTYRKTEEYGEPAAQSSSGSEHYPDSLRSDEDGCGADLDSFVTSKIYTELENTSLGMEVVDSFNRKLNGVRLDESALIDLLPSQKSHANILNASFTLAIASPTDSLESGPPVISGPVSLEISPPPRFESVTKYAVSGSPVSSKSSQGFHRDKMTKVLKSTGVKMKHTKRTQGKALKNLKLLPVKCKDKMTELLSPVSTVSTSRRGKWGISNPFRGSSVYQTEEWMANQEREFTKWLNALLTPPAQLDCYTSIPTVDVVELWKKSCRSKTVELAPSREVVSSRYNIHYRLDRLRHAARDLFCSEKVMNILRKVSSHVNKKMICIRADRLVYKDVGLRCSIVELLLSYNPLWLRIGLEALYNERIPLRSNSDILGLATFIRTRVLSDPYTVKKFTHPTVRNYYLRGFEDAINKFILKKLFFLVYLLDLAKNSKLISHNPCLFCKNSKVKKSRDVLVFLTREIISKMGDITSYLRHLDYVVTHEQTYLDEYDYAVINLSQDLRDGIRLTRVMEIILQKPNLSKQLRYPPISLLQKKHNVEVALRALEHEGYTLEDEITIKDIAEGHREKTLSLLWQLIYKFEAPLFTKASIVLQRWWRSKLQHRIRAAVCIQRMWRSHVNSRRLQVVESNKKEYMYCKAAISIQSAWRCYVARKHVKKLNSEHSAAVSIQSAWRCYVARKHLKKVKLEHRAAVSIQGVWRCYITKKHMKKLTSEHRAAVSIQSAWRCYIARKRLKKLKSEHRAAVSIQSAWRCYVARKYLKKLKLEHRAAVFIQSAWRCCVARKHLKKLKLEHRAAVFIQSAWRFYIARKHLKKLTSEHRAAVSIQCMWRCYIARKHLKKLTSEHRAAVSIQSAWRCYVAGKHLNKLKLEHRAAVSIQGAWRCYVARKHLKKLKSEHKAAVSIQCAWRCYIAREHLKKLTSEHRAAVSIQCVWRYYIARKHLKKLKSEHKAALSIQCAWRCYIARKHLKKLKSEHRAAVSIQNAWRCYVARKHLNKLKLEHRAAVFIQGALRCYVAKKHLKKLTLEHRAAVSIQSAWRCYIARKHLKKLTSEHIVAVSIQSAWRCYVARKHLKKLKSEHRAAVSIQCAWRCYIAMEHLKKLKLEHRAAVSIQGAWRCYVARKHLKKLKLEHSAAVSIQSAWRCYIARKYLKKLTSEHTAAVSIQCVWRCYLAQKHLKKLKSEHSAAVSIQSAWRCYIAGKHLKSEHTAAVSIQCAWRCYVARMHVMKLKLEHSAAVSIQSALRCYMARKHLKKLKLEHRAAVSIQGATRFCVVRKQLKEHVAAVKIQQAWRCYISKKQLKKLNLEHNSAVTIQKMWKCYKIKNILLVHKAEIHARSVEMLKSESLQVKINCAIKIQKCWRGYIARQYFKLMHERVIRASIVIQRYWRGYRTRKLIRCVCTVSHDPNKSLKNLFHSSIEALGRYTSLGDLMHALITLDTVTRLSPEICIAVCKYDIVNKLCEICSGGNRSEAYVDIYDWSLRIIINLLVFEEVSAKILKTANIRLLADCVLRIISAAVSSRKKQALCNCYTVLWLLGSDQATLQTMRSIKDFSKFLLFYSEKARKLPEVLKEKSGKECVPVREPRWTLRYQNQERSFTSVKFCTKVVLQLFYVNR